MNKLKPHPWLPDKTSYGEPVACQNCKHYGEDKDTSPTGKCGRYNFICGNWEEAGEVQMEIRYE